MKWLFASIPVFLFFGVIADDHPPGKVSPPVVRLSGLSNLHHKVSTKDAQAQEFFDQGLRLIFAFNHDEARRSFQRAAELDADLAMAYWGIALSVGPNYNADADAQQWKSAYQAIQEAIKLAPKASEVEREYIQALALRYSADPKRDTKKLAVDYNQAMAALARRYPDDLDAATLYAESAMNLRPWDLWSPDGKAREGTLEILTVLEAVLRRNPDHIGANHYYIHAIEASPTPERGLEAARRLGSLGLQTGHLVHMPAHIFMRVGDYAAAADANEKAVAIDREYIHKHKVQGIYSMMYYSHNLHFLAVAHAMQGRYKDARKAADQLAAHVGPHVHDMPMLEGFLPTPTLMCVRFQRWDEILQMPQPDAKQILNRSLWHYARGLALVEKGKTEEAEKELKAFRDLQKTIPEDAMFGPRNASRKVLTIPEKVLAARIAFTRKDDSLALLKEAIQAEDELNYMEPSDWYLPVRETLGALLLQSGNAAEAEMVFRADLERNRRNGRSLFGLMKSLQAQGKTHAAQMVQQELDAAWRNAEPEFKQLRIKDL